MEHNPTCACGHLKSEHIHEEGACRPGYTCKERCEEFRPEKDRPEKDRPTGDGAAKMEQFLRDIKERSKQPGPERLDGLTIRQWRFTAMVQKARANSMEKYSAELVQIIEQLDI